MNLDCILIVCYCIDFFLCSTHYKLQHLRSLEQIATCECEGSDFLVQWRACLAGFESMQPMGFVTFLLLNHESDRLFEDRGPCLFPKFHGWVAIRLWIRLWIRGCLQCLRYFPPVSHGSHRSRQINTLCFFTP